MLKTTKAAVMVRRLEQTSETNPAQWEGADDKGRTIVIYYQHGVLTVVRDQEEDAEVLFTGKLGRPRDGFITIDKVRQATAGVLEIP